MADPADEFFDLERLRRKWEPPAPRRPKEIVHPVLAKVRPAIDPREQAAQTMKSLREECQSRLPDRADTLRPFLDEVEQKLRAVIAAEADAPTEESLAALDKAIDQLEELLEVFAFVAPRAP